MKENLMKYEYWRPISNVLPPEDVDVLLFRENGEMGVGSIFKHISGELRVTFNGTGFFVSDQYEGKKVTHWRHLPEQPNENE